LCLSIVGPTNIQISGEIKLFKIINAFVIFKVDILSGIDCIAACKEINLFNDLIVLKRSESNSESKALDLELSGPSLSLKLPGLKDVADIQNVISKLEFNANICLKIFGLKCEAIFQLSSREIFVLLSYGVCIPGLKSNAKGRLKINENRFDFGIWFQLIIEIPLIPKLQLNDISFSFI